MHDACHDLPVGMAASRSTVADSCADMRSYFRDPPLASIPPWQGLLYRTATRKNQINSAVPAGRYFRCSLHTRIVISIGLGQIDFGSTTHAPQPPIHRGPVITRGMPSAVRNGGERFQGFTSQDGERSGKRMKVVKVGKMTQDQISRSEAPNNLQLQCGFSTGGPGAGMDYPRDPFTPSLHYSIPLPA